MRRVAVCLALVPVAVWLAATVASAQGLALQAQDRGADRSGFADRDAVSPPLPLRARESGATPSVLGGPDWLFSIGASSPPPRDQAAMAYDAARGRVVLVGGCCTSGLLADTW